MPEMASAAEGVSRSCTPAATCSRAVSAVGWPTRASSENPRINHKLTHPERRGNKMDSWHNEIRSLDAICDLMQSGVLVWIAYLLVSYKRQVDVAIRLLRRIQRGDDTSLP
jgi:hypothetical protein